MPSLRTLVPTAVWIGCSNTCIHATEWNAAAETAVSANGAGKQVTHLLARIAAKRECLKVFSHERFCRENTDRENGSLSKITCPHCSDFINPPGLLNRVRIKCDSLLGPKMKTLGLWCNPW